MAFKLLLICALAAYTSAQSFQSNKYPAGVHPNLCPHYPYCDNTVLAGFAQGVASFHSAGLAAPGYPAALSPHACPNYPYCSHQIPPEAIHYRRSTPYQHQPFAAASHVPYPVVASVGSPAKYPSGVDPASCPNYPYCH
ncbi:cuticle protein 1 [Planococcus citri]|uniref:cuticle protein 1 n=1 Tax=Planococcus citri TaxID=170843 RepID=UPI0031F7A25D